MGLAERKVKQRIAADPRNLAWINDSSKFGEKYLQNLGWTSGQGLGLTGDGRTDNIKIHQKLDLLGIGANRRGPEADDWRAGREYDNLLNRLNQGQNDPQISEILLLSGSDKASVSHLSPEGTGQIPVKKKRKRYLDESVEEKQGEDLKKKIKIKIKEGEEVKVREEKKKKRRDARRASKEGSSPVPAQAAIPQTVVGDQMSTAKGPMYRAHRKKNLDAKRLAAASSQSLREILGISTTDEDGPITDEPRKEKDAMLQSETSLLRKSEKSMVDYFSEKLRLKKQKS